MKTCTVQFLIHAAIFSWVYDVQNALVSQLNRRGVLRETFRILFYAEEYNVGLEVQLYPKYWVSIGCR